MLQDLRFGFRMLLKSPGFTVAAILSLTIGIGATSAIFSVVNNVVLRPLPFRDPERLVRIWHNKTTAGMTRMPVSAGNINIWRNQSHSFDDYNDDETSPPVAIINETMARSLFSGTDPVGQRLALKGAEDKWLEIVGVTMDVKQFGLDVENKPAFYRPYRQEEGHS